jgi:hypothetical protein
MITLTYASSLLLLPLVAAHFNLDYPKARGFDEDLLVKFPCGGQNEVSKTRTDWPLKGKAPIQLTMGHDQALVQVLLAVGNDPGDNFNVVLVPTFQEMGLNQFCLGDVQLPDNLNLKEGTNATVQVVTNGDPNGGLYNCADITFTNTPLSSSDYNSHCTNSTGVVTKSINDPSVNANGSTATKSGGAPATSSDVAGTVNAAGWLLGAAGVVGGLVAL